PLDLTVALGDVTLKNPVVCGSGEHVMTPSALDAALDAGAAAVVAKSAGTSPLARRQLDSAEYALLDAEWSLQPRERGMDPGASLFNRSGLPGMPFEEGAALLAAAHRRAAGRDAYVVGSALPASAEEAPELVRTMDAAGLR